MFTVSLIVYGRYLTNGNQCTPKLWQRITSASLCTQVWNTTKNKWPVSPNELQWPARQWSRNLGNKSVWIDSLFISGGVYWVIIFTWCHTCNQCYYGNKMKTSLWCSNCVLTQAFLLLHLWNAFSWLPKRHFLHAYGLVQGVLIQGWVTFCLYFFNTSIFNYSVS